MLGIINSLGRGFTCKYVPEASAAKVDGGYVCISGGAEANFEGVQGSYPTPLGKLPLLDSRPNVPRFFRKKTNFAGTLMDAAIPCTPGARARENLLGSLGEHHLSGPVRRNRR